MPLVHLDWLQELFESSPVVIARSTLNAVTVYGEPGSTAVSSSGGSPIPLWLYVYALGCLVQAFFFLKNYLRMTKQLKTNSPGEAYSFMKTIKVDTEQVGSKQIWEHETIHSKQLHTVDVFFVELIKLFNWFNPLVYLLGKSLKLTHEYIADDAVNKSHAERIAYAELLIGRSFSVSPAALSNNFFTQSLIKSRIMMLFKDKSKRPALFKYVLAVPLFIAMLVFSSAKVSDKATDLTTLNILPDQDLEAFYNLVAQKVNYLPQARKDQVQGVVDVAFEHRGGEIKSLKTLYTMGYNEEKEVERALRLPEVKRLMPEGKYVLRMKFILWKVAPKELDPPIVSPSDHELLKVITLVGYPGTGQTAHSTDGAPPPPPPPTVKKVIIKKKEGDDKVDSVKLGTNLASNTVNVDEVRDEPKNSVKSMNEVEVAPSFPGGLHTFYQWIATHYKYPKEAKEQGVSGTLQLSFIINEDGSLSGIRLIRDLGYGTGEEALRMIKECPKWLPGIINGKPIKVSYNLPIKLNLNEPKKQRDSVKTVS